MISGRKRSESIVSETPTSEVAIMSIGVRYFSNVSNTRVR